MSGVCIALDCNAAFVIEMEACKACILFCRLLKYFNGCHHLEDIMLLENLPRSKLLTLIDKFSNVLVTCLLPEA